jgi:hypothetical protein
MSISINGTNGVTFNDGSLQKTSAQTGFRNRIINGDMRIDQRNGGASVNLSSSGAFPIDRFVAYTTSGTGNTATRSTTAASGFTNSIAITIGTGAAPIAGSFNQIGHIIEGFNVSDLGFGSASAGSVTISFWVRASISGTYCVALLNAGYAGTRRSYIAEYSISATNTWEKKTLTISGDTSGTWATDNGQGIQLWFDFGSGSDYQGTKDNWSNGAKWRTSNQTNLVGTNGATFYITGVQLEAGSTATEFERRPYGTELALCQRYYYRITGSNGWYQPVGSGTNRSSTTCRVSSVVPVAMRTTPTVTMSTGANAPLAVSSATDLGVSSLSNAYGGSNSMILDIALNSTVTIGHAIVVYVGTDNTMFAQFNSEL